MISMFEDEQWQMTLGERAALEGVLSELKPRLSVEVGTFRGGSLRRIAAHSGEVHSFDMELPPGAGEFENVSFHTGDSHSLLPAWLDEVRREGRRVDFALVDGDHSTLGVKADIQDILTSGVLDGVMLFHDPMYPPVRRGLKQADFDGCSDLRYLELDFVPGHVGSYGSGFAGQLFGGLGIAVVGDAVASEGLRQFASGGVKQDAHVSAYALMRPTAELMGLPARVSRVVRRGVERVRR